MKLFINEDDNKNLLIIIAAVGVFYTYVFGERMVESTDKCLHLNSSELIEDKEFVSINAILTNPLEPLLRMKM